ncbi:MAG: hypothetical protein KHX34_06405, partial [Clostridiales bacterium]|nr:hypothetical protein [Clostridiales bacterium]
PPQVATFSAFLSSPTTRSHFATMQCGFFDRLKGPAIGWPGLCMSEKPARAGVFRHAEMRFFFV